MNKPKPLHVILGALLFLALLGAAVALRFAALDKSLWVDEVTSYVIAGQKTARGVLALSSAKFTAHPPLYYLLVHYWFHVWGQSVMAMRALSAVFGLLAVAMMYPVAVAIFRRRATGFVAMAIAAFSPFAVYISQLGRMYSLLTLLTLAALWAFVKLADENTSPRFRAWLWIFLAADMAALMYTHYYGANVVILLTALAFARRRGAGPGFLWKWVLLLAVVAAAWSPWLAVFARQSQSVSQIMDTIIPGPVQPVQYLVALIGTGTVFSGAPIASLTMEQFTALFVFSCLTLLLFGAWTLLLYRNHKKEIGLVYIYLAVPTALMLAGAVFVKGIVFPWHFAYISPAPMLLAACALTFGKARIARAALAFVAVVVSIFGLVACCSAKYWSDDWRSVSQHIIKYSENIDTVLSMSPLNDYPMKDYYLRGTGIKVKSFFSATENRQIGADPAAVFADTAFRKDCFWVVGAPDTLNATSAFRRAHFKKSREKTFPAVFTQKPIKAMRLCIINEDKPMRRIRREDFIDYLLSVNKVQTSEQARFARAEFLFSRGYIKLAEKEMRDALTENPDSVRAMENLARILQEQGRENQAREFIDRARKMRSKP